SAIPPAATPFYQTDSSVETWDGAPACPGPIIGSPTFQAGQSIFVWVTDAEAFVSSATLDLTLGMMDFASGRAFPMTAGWVLAQLVGLVALVALLLVLGLVGLRASRP